MAILSKEEFIRIIGERIGEDVSDEALQFIEDMTDTYESLEVNNSSEWEEKYNKLDNDWRNKYKERFLSGGIVEEQVDEIIDDELEEREETIDYNDILKEVD